MPHHFPCLTLPGVAPPSCVRVIVCHCLQAARPNPAWNSRHDELFTAQVMAQSEARIRRDVAAAAEAFAAGGGAADGGWLIREV